MTSEDPVRPPQSSFTVTRKAFISLAVLPAAVGIVLWWVPGGGLVAVLLESYAVVLLTLLLGAGIALGLRRALWRVGHRLSFSYFLIGVVPIPLVALLVLVAAYIGTGFLLGHLYRDAVHSVASELRFAGEAQLDRLKNRDTRVVRTPLPVAFAYYRDGKRLAGDAQAPRYFQEWWVKETIETAAPSPVAAPYVALADGRPTLMAALAEGRYAVLAYYTGDLELELSERSGVWVELLRADEDRGGRPLSFKFQEREYALRLPRLDLDDEEMREFFYQGDDDPGFFDRPALVWAEISRPFLDLGAGTRAADYVYATLRGSPRTIQFHLISRSAEVDTFAYLVLAALAFALFDIWVLAVLMALLMIWGLTQAVNKLSRATRQVQLGDFSARIEVLRKDQLGELQRSFNVMTANLESLVASAAQKEILERDLELARELQRSLLPAEVSTDETLAFATHFAPCAAIGGDYFDVLPVADGRLAVVVADVSGHGVAAGLRMAMVKSALQLLAEQESDPREILRRLHELQKSSAREPRKPGSHRGFVTATLALVDRDSGEVEITNAGHAPTYLWRSGVVTEIALPSLPLGVLDRDPCQRRLTLEPGDALVWLSDGLIEAIDPREEPFGYDAVVHCLESVKLESVKLEGVKLESVKLEGVKLESAAPAAGGDLAAALRDRLLADLESHTGGAAPDDDRTLVVMVYRPPAVPADESETAAGAEPS